MAVQKGDEKMIGLLFEYHCDPNKKNKNKKSAYDLCEGNPKLLQYLEQLYSKSKVNFFHQFMIRKIKLISFKML
jgi:hypothetical protein